MTREDFVYAPLWWHKEGDYGDMLRYNSKSGATCFFISDWEEEEQGMRSYKEI